MKLLGLCDFGAFMPWCFEFISSMTCASRQNDYGTIKHILSLSLTKMCNWTKQYRMNNNILLISCHIYLWYVVQYNYFKFLPTFNELKKKWSNSEVDNIKCYSGDELHCNAELLCIYAVRYFSNLLIVLGYVELWKKPDHL